MSKRHGEIVIALNLFSLIVGIVNLLMLESEIVHTLYIVIVSVTLLGTIVVKEKTWIRPYSYMILSFVVFVWMRYVLNILVDTDIISIGNGINPLNTSLVAIYLGIAMNIISITSVVTEHVFVHRRIALFESQSRLTVPKFAENLVVVLAICFFLIFIIDSIKKVSIVNTAEYLQVSETLLMQGYVFFTLGKQLLLLWILFGKDENRFFKASTILMVAGTGYLMRGARGYAIMYIFMWILFLSFRYHIKLFYLIFLGIGLIYLANFILSYRLGWSVADGFWNIIQSTLYSQGSSVEPVFGSVIFRDQILQKFSIGELFTRYDFGVIVDQIRGTGFERGGFGSSFFAEAFFMGPYGFLVLVLAGICLGILERAYHIIRYAGSKCEYSQIILYMTIPNLIYLGRSSVKDFIFKTIAAIVIVLVLQDMASRNSVRLIRMDGNKKGYERRMCDPSIKL